MNKALTIIIIFCFLLVPSITYSDQPAMIASVNLAEVFNGSDRGKKAKEYLLKLTDDQREEKEPKVRKILLREISYVISKIGEEGKYALILDENGYFYSRNKMIDITDKVIERYNIYYASKLKKPSGKK